MVKDNKGYSLIEVIISITIMAIISCVCFLSYAAATQNEPQKVRSDIETRCNYLRDIVKAKSQDNAALLFKSSSDDKYYYARGTYTVADGFKSFDGAQDPSALIAGTNETSADTVSFGKKVDIYYNSAVEASKGDGISGAALLDGSSYVLFRYSKKDGSVISGGGSYYVSKRGIAPSASNASITKLVYDTGVFVDYVTPQ